MQIETSIIILSGIVFVSIIGLSVFRTWNRTSAAALQIEMTRQTKNKIEELEEQIVKSATAAKNWKARYRHSVRNYELDLDDEEMEEIEQTDPKDADSLSDLAKTLYPNLPKSISQIIDSENFQNAIVQSATKNPEGVLGFLDKIVPKGGGNAKPEVAGI